jgi:hypothetical protein
MSGLLVGLIKILPLALLAGRGELDSVRARDASWLLLLLAGDVIVHYILHDVNCGQVFERVAVCVCCRLLLLLLVTVEKQGAAST